MACGRLDVYVPTDHAMNRETDSIECRQIQWRLNRDFPLRLKTVNELRNLNDKRLINQHR